MSDPRDLERIAALEGQVADKDAQLAVRDAQIAAQGTRITELESKVEELVQLVMALKEQLNRNSKNSHLPPSSDGPGGRSSPEKSKGEGQKKRGGQPGHGGHKRELIPAEEVDRFVELYPNECENCWVTLPQVRDGNATRYQVTEVPPIRPHTTEYRCNGVTCACGHTTFARAEGVVPLSPFGPRLMALIGLLTGVYHLGRRRAVTLLHDVLGVRISLGAVSAVEGRVSAAIEASVTEAWSKVDDTEVKHADATSWLLAGNLRSLWTIATKVVTVFKILVNGSAAAVKPIFGTCKGILVSDRAHRLLVLVDELPSDLLGPLAAQVCRLLRTRWPCAKARAGTARPHRVGVLLLAGLPGRQARPREVSRVDDACARPGREVSRARSRGQPQGSVRRLRRHPLPQTGAVDLRGPR